MNLGDYKINTLEKYLVIIVIILSIIIGIQFGFIYKLSSTDNINKNTDSIINNYSVQNIPDQFNSTNKNTTASIEYNFNRPGDNKIFDYKTHDPLLIQENNTSYLIVGSEETQKLYKSNNITNRTSWKLVDGNYLRSIFEADDVVQTENRITIYTGSSVYTTNEPIEKDNWTRENNSYISEKSVYYDQFGDSGIYYDSINDTYHLYYEKGNKADFSGVAIGHAVSNNGIDNWKIYPEVWNSTGSEYGVGDFDIIKRNNTIIMFGDYDKKHPKYSVAVWTNNNPYTKFKKSNESAIKPRNSSDSYDDNYGVGDPEVVNTNNDEYIIFANGYHNSSNKAKLHYYTGYIK